MARAGDADVEPIIASWAKAGVFANAGKAAIAHSHSKGNAVTIIENGVVYRFLPDGTRQELRKLVQKSGKKFTRGRFTIKK